MATATRVPTGDGTTLQWTPTSAGSNWDEVDDTIAGADDGTTTVSVSANTDQNDYYTFANTPADFGTANTFQKRMREQISGVVDDGCRISISILESDELTLVSPGATLGPSGNHSWTTTNSAAHSNSENKAAWDNGRRIGIQSVRTNSGMPDSVTFEVTAVELVLDYNIAAGIASLRQLIGHGQGAR